MAVGDQDHQSVALTVTTALFSRLDQPVDLTFSQILTPRLSAVFQWVSPNCRVFGNRCTVGSRCQSGGFAHLGDPNCREKGLISRQLGRPAKSNSPRQERILLRQSSDSAPP